MPIPTAIANVMVRLGILVRLTVVGRKSGLERVAVVNKANAPDGGLYVAAGRKDSQWALNLRAAGRCTVSIKGDERDFTATELDGDERDAAVRALAPPFARGKTRIEGPAFRLVPARSPAQPS